MFFRWACGSLGVQRSYLQLHSCCLNRRQQDVLHCYSSHNNQDCPCLKFHPELLQAYLRRSKARLIVALWRLLVATFHANLLYPFFLDWLVVAYHRMTVYLQYLQLLRTLIILLQIGPHSIKVLAFSLKITRATPRMSESPCPHYSLAER